MHTLTLSSPPQYSIGSIKGLLIRVYWLFGGQINQGSMDDQQQARNRVVSSFLLQIPMWLLFRSQLIRDYGLLEGYLIKEGQQQQLVISTSVNGVTASPPQRFRWKKLRWAVQYVRFPSGPPPEYQTRPWLLSFGDRTGSGVSNQV